MSAPQDAIDILVEDDPTRPKQTLPTMDEVMEDLAIVKFLSQPSPSKPLLSAAKTKLKVSPVWG